MGPEKNKIFILLRFYCGIDRSNDFQVHWILFFLIFNSIFYVFVFRNITNYRIPEYNFAYGYHYCFFFFYCCSSTVVSIFAIPLPPPHPSPPLTLNPNPLWFLWILYTCSLMTPPLLPHVTPLLSPLWLLSVCSLFQCLWLYLLCSCVLLIRFHW